MDLTLLAQKQGRLTITEKLRPVCSKVTSGEISSERDGTKKMMKNLNIIQISHLTFEYS